MPRKKKQTGAGKMSIADMRAIINKKAGMEVAYDLSGDNPTAVWTGFLLVRDGLIRLSARIPSRSPSG